MSIEGGHWLFSPVSPHRRHHSHAALRPPEPQLDQHVALELNIGDQRRPFDRVRAGPVLGELVVGDRAYLVAAISNLLALIEVRAAGGRVIWGGRAEKLPEVVLETGAEDA